MISMNETLGDFVSMSAVQPIVVQTKRHEIYKLDATDQRGAEKKTADSSVADCEQTKNVYTYYIRNIISLTNNNLYNIVLVNFIFYFI